MCVCEEKSIFFTGRADAILKTHFAFFAFPYFTNRFAMSGGMTDDKAANAVGDIFETTGEVTTGTGDATIELLTAAAAPALLVPAVLAAAAAPEFNGFAGGPLSLESSMLL